ncbi:Rha family transcriptional regulator [Paenibacillus sp. MMO-58]|uniref:Rha family transcriptional regulator n=1 Tax=Paenibacillus sp. MMO-58 TaxID=3081290 RepID=UPI00301AAE2D
MNPVVFIENGQAVTDSLTVAETFGKNHKDVLRDIRNLDCSEEFNQRNFAPIDYKDVGGRTYQKYLITQDGFSFLVMGYTGKEAARFKEMYIGEFNRMRQQLSGPLVPQSLPEALRLAATLAEEKEALMLQAAQDKPKVLFAEAVTASKTSILVGELAKILKQNGIDIGQNRFFEWLRENGYLINRKGTDYNMPTQRSMELELFEIKETAINHSDGHVSVSKTPKVTGKGQVYFVNKLKGA